MSETQQLETEQIAMYSKGTGKEIKAIYSTNMMQLASDNEDFKALQKGINENYQPANQIESILVSIIIENTWRLNLISKTEQGLFKKKEIEETIIKNKEVIQAEVNTKGATTELLSMILKAYREEKENPLFKENAVLADSIEKLIVAEKEAETEPMRLATTFHNDATSSETFAKLTRYRKSAEHSLYKAIDKLNNLQKHRLSLELLVAKSVGINDAE